MHITLNRLSLYRIMINMLMCPCKVNKHLCNVFYIIWITCIYKNKNKLMEHFDNIAEIHRPSPQVQPCEQSSRETEDQILEDTLLNKYLKRRKVKRKWLNFFWIILIYNKKNLHGFFLCFMNEWLNECFNEWFTDFFYRLLTK